MNTSPAGATPVACHVQADTPWGSVRLGLTASASPRSRNGPWDDIDTALAVEQCEPLLIELEGWLACPLDPCPVHANTPEPKGLRAIVRASTPAGLAPPGSECLLPWAALLNRPAPSGLLRSQLSWPSLNCELEVARYTRPPRCGPRPHSGSVMLLPLSFDERWRVRLAQQDHGVELHADLHMNSACLTACGPLRMAALHEGTEPTAWRVMLHDAIEAPADWLLGWCDTGLAVEAAGARARMLGPKGLPSWTEGTIVPALRGAALLVDTAEALQG